MPATRQTEDPRGGLGSTAKADKTMTDARTTGLLLTSVLLGGCAGGDIDPHHDQAIPWTGLIEHDNAVQGRYLVVMRGDEDSDSATDEASMMAFAAEHGGKHVRAFGSRHRGFSASLSFESAHQLAEDPRVLFVEADALVYGDQSAGRPGLDRIDQRDLPMDGEYSPFATGAGVTAYVVDTGVRLSHQQFEGRAIAGYNAVQDGNGESDCNGHGTHVAGIVGGVSFGVAPEVDLVSVRVLGCDNSGSLSGLIEGLDWIRDNLSLPAVVNISLAAPESVALQTAIDELVDAGATIVTSAGNHQPGASLEKQDSCAQSPANLSQVITVAATDADDALTPFSKHGACVDISALGMGVTSAAHDSDDGSRMLDGTSQAAPHVAGAAALVLEVDPHASPAAVAQRLRELATQDGVQEAPEGTQRSLLFVGVDDDPDCLSSCESNISGLCFGMFADRCPSACDADADAITGCLATASTCADAMTCTF